MQIKKFKESKEIKKIIFVVWQRENEVILFKIELLDLKYTIFATP